MSLSRWQTVSHIFETALDLPASEREGYIRQACAGDSQLESEVFRLLAADENAGSFLAHPALTTVPAQPNNDAPTLLADGSVVAGRFEILRFIGQGGMGQVYAALDRELNVRIALKAIRPEIASDPRMLSRFRREVQLTRLITHPNVCRTFDIERHGSGDGQLTFLTMELVEGETLSVYLRRACQVTPAEALPFVLQMIDALSAAHIAGIIHRDFKPSNVLLARAETSASDNSSSRTSSSEIPSGNLRVVVTDFGLARAIFRVVPSAGREVGESVATLLTAEQTLMGTPIYMAPEQFERGETSVASDIYSLGLVMFEMVTGQRPFHDDISMAEATKRLKQPAPLASKVVPDIDPVWDAAISRCLALEPKDRFESVQHVRAALAEPEAKGMRPSSASSVADSTGYGRHAAQAKLETHRASRRHAILAVAVIITILMSLFALAFRHYLQRQTPIQFAERDWILVTDFTNQTGERLFDRVVRDLAVESLSQSSYINMVPRLSALQAAKRARHQEISSIDDRLGRELCLREHYKALLNGNIFKNGSRYTIAMQVQNPGKDSTSISETETIQSPDELFAGVDRIVTRIRRDLGESLSKIETNTKPLAQVTTSSLEALQRYSAAVDLYGAGEYTRCVNLANDAVSMDQTFAMAHLLLAEAYEQIGDEAKSQDQIRLAKTGLKRVSERERHLILAVSYSYELANEKAADEYQHLLDISPDDIDALKGFASEAFWAGHTDAAINAQKKAVVIDPNGADGYDKLLTLLVRTNRFTEALEVYRQAQAHGADGPDPRFLAALSSWGTRNLLDAKARLEVLRRDGPRWNIVGTLFLGKLLAFQGHIREAIEVFHSGLALVQNPELAYWLPTFRYQIARAELIRGDAAAARTETRKLVSESEQFPTPVNLQRAGKLSMQIGDMAAARKLLLLAEQQVSRNHDPFSEMELHDFKGDLALALGHTDEAIREDRIALTFRVWYRPFLSLGEACEAVHNWQCAIDAYTQYASFQGAIIRDDAVEDWVIAHDLIARAYFNSGDATAAKQQYALFLSFFSSADTDLPILRNAGALLK
jgi:tetratricopeptide (TPR) repeat protein/tRNA A-37 threonylcarbamoyl transferase component Bud32